MKIANLKTNAITALKITAIGVGSAIAIIALTAVIYAAILNPAFETLAFVTTSLALGFVWLGLALHFKRQIKAVKLPEPTCHITCK
ncbi:hypothetical protein [Thiothrix fructosivorans]|uniref:Uncharacterized protein n=1 Tax=Thiothrix fructosivorans TaxID=111770 RepID=A0A8B0SI10_9GAMM|nr:hypothetical protein [Thiothrix fructosivorans]MBO0611686.1 hypothetical protein [Thiothrix fructosivorans]QTX10654.1 hypothetical protein J1836_019150 [Thiothrix fructosivorans]